jgi:CheY-like chemotaxis protein
VRYGHAGLDGYATLAAIRRNPRTYSLPVLAVSVRNQAEDIQRALEAGANSYITKPFQRLQLLEEIQRFLTAKGVP